MPPLQYHHGQLAIQEEAKTSFVASKLAHWVGPVSEFALEADLFLLAMEVEGDLRMTVLSGEPPLLSISSSSQRRHLPGQVPEAGPRLRFSPELLPPPDTPTPCGGLAINLAQARRVRINGLLTNADGVSALLAQETFTLCRKYMVPSLPRQQIPSVGPTARESIPLEDPWLISLLARAETAFLASVSPEGGPDIAHRGGPAGFLRLIPSSRELSWEEYVGDGVFKSAGNVRATGQFTLLVPDIETGDGVELVGRGEYLNLRGDRHERLDALVEHRSPFPVQGRMICRVEEAMRLRGLLHPRERLASGTTVTSCSPVDEQAPQ